MNDPNKPRDVRSFPRGTDAGRFVLQHDFANAKHFLRALQPSSGFWFDHPRAWIFRGHADADWPLLPSAHRTVSWWPFRPSTKHPFVPELANEHTRQTREHELVRAFFHRADQLGLPLPVIEPPRRPSSPAVVGYWPKRESLPIVALAQHYGVPTRLLDWTRRGPVAAYFACLEPRVEPGEAAPTKMAVWALNRRFLKAHGMWAPGRPGHGRAPIPCYVATAPRSSNPFLHAQAGLFTYSPHLKHMEGLDLLVARIVDSVTAAGVTVETAPCVLRLLTLPRTEADHLLELLHEQEISALTMFPGFAGIAQLMKEEFRLGELAPED